MRAENKLSSTDLCGRSFTRSSAICSWGSRASWGSYVGAGCSWPRSPASYLLNAAAAFGVAGLAPQANLALTLNGLFIYFAAGATLFPLRRQGSLGLAVGPRRARRRRRTDAPRPLAPLLSPLAIAYIVISLGLTALRSASAWRTSTSPMGSISFMAWSSRPSWSRLPQVRTWWEACLITLPVTLAIAYCSWTFIEHPILSHKSRIARTVDRFADRISQVVPPVRLLMGRSLNIRPAAGPAKGE